MQKIFTLLLSALALSAIAGSPKSGPKKPVRASRPSLLLITLDTTRADHLGCYGYKAARTPNLDALAARGVRFENAFVSAPITLSSHATIMTGTFPARHGARDNGLFKLNRDVETLAEALKKNGYQTAAFVSAAVLDRQFGLNRGFDFYDDNVRVGEQRAFAYQERAANQVTEAVSDHLPRLKQNGKPFFLWIHYYDAHHPWVAPNPFKTQFAKNPYDGELAFVDENIGYLFEELKKAGLDRNLITVALGDHGEMLGEHGEPNHGVFLYRGALQVPLIIAGPQVAVRVIPDRFQVSDLANTLLRAMGKKELRTSLGMNFCGWLNPAWGADLSPSSREDCTPNVVRDSLGDAVVINPRDWEDRYSLEETFMPYFSYGFSPLMGLRHMEFHFIEAPQAELYDIKKDPGETRNLLAAAGGEKLHQEWSAQLARALKNYGGPRARDQQKLPLPNANADPALLKSLAQLGYVGNAGGGTENLPDPKDAIDLVVKLRKGEALSGEGKHAEAAAIYEEVIRRAPSNFNAYGLLANERLSLKQPAEALRIYQAALKKNGRLEFLRLGEAATLAALDDASAEGKFRAMIRDNPRFADGFMAYYEFLHRKNRHDEAKADLDAALKAGHDDAEIRYRLGEEEFRSGNLPTAEMQLRKAIAFNKYHAEALARLGELTAKSNPGEARGYYLRAIEERPDRTDWRNAMMALGK